MKKPLLVTGLCFLSAAPAFACITCNKEIQEAIFNSMFYAHLGFMFSAFVVLAVIVFLLSRLSTNRYNARLIASPNRHELASVPLTTAAMVLGIGLGGFFDGIVFHQILQWHEMLTAKLPADTVVNKSVNMFWDGIFHSFTLITTIAGVRLLWKLLQKKELNRSGYLMTGGLLMGWGLFNLVEGIINHHILGLHNVRELTTQQTAWNIGFLLFGVFLLGIGWMQVRIGEKEGMTV